MRKQARKPLVISPVPATGPANGSRPMSLKRLSRLRINWFVVGCVFGIGASFFMNFLVTAFIMPQYQQFAGHKKELQITEAKPQDLLNASTESAIKTAEKQANPEKAEEKEVAKAEPKPEPKVEAPITYPQTVALQIGRGDTLLNLLIAHRVLPAEANNVIAALKSKVNAQKLPVGQKISVTLARHETLGDKAAVRELAIKLPNFDTIELQRTQQGVFNVAATKEELKMNAYRGYGVVKSSLSQAAASGSIPNSALSEVVKAFSYDIDFQRDIHPGDTIEVLMDRKTASDGRVGGYGPPRYAALTLQGKKHEIFRFKNSYGDLAWFDGKGNSIKKSLLRTPINAAHITSGFGMRLHPLLGYSKMHKGVDFGAETGTPIMAAGDGTVEFKGWQNGYGNFVVIKHNGTYETAYGHMSRFGNISEGNRVRQGQIIGYVGMTGGATGPHLHYEVRANEHQVNPVSKQFNLANGLTGKSLAAFNAGKATAMKDLAALKAGKTVSSKLADADIDEPAEAAAPKTAKASKAKPVKAKKATGKRSRNARA